MVTLSFQDDGRRHDAIYRVGRSLLVTEWVEFIDTSRYSAAVGQIVRKFRQN
jgi:hypothetical protein